MYDLIVVGGGPAGAAAAITSARDGARVLLLERGRYPRHKVCGEFVSAESLDILKYLLTEQNLPLLDAAFRISRTRLFLENRTFNAAIKPAAASIARVDLDFALWNSAIAAGVDARQQVAVQAIDGAGPFRIMTADANYEGRALIDASGRWSNLNADSFQGDKSPDKWIGLKAHFGESSPENSVDLYFFDGGYCGVSPVNVVGSDSGNRVNACAMVRANTAISLAEVVELHPELRARSQDWQLLIEPVSTSPLIFRQPRPVQGSVLRAGDAAGFVDPFVGDGISLSLRSGALAAQCLGPFFQRKIFLGAALRSYEEAYDEWLRPVFRTSAVLRRLLVLPEVLRKPLLSVMGNAPRVADYLVSKTR